MSCARPELIRHPWRWLMVALLVSLGTACSNSQVKLPEETIAAASLPISRDKTIALLGGTGMAGGYILRDALAHGYKVRALSRNGEKLAYLGDRISVIEGDARDPQVIEQLLSGSDVVITAIGPRNQQDARDMLTTTVSGHVADAMLRQGISRYIVVTGAAVEITGDSRNLTGWTMKQLARIRFPNLVRDRQAEYQLLAGTELEWVLVRCPLIEAADFQREAAVSFVAPYSFHLRAGELARFVIEQVESDRYVRRGPALHSR